MMHDFRFHLHSFVLFYFSPLVHSHAFHWLSCLWVTKLISFVLYFTGSLISKDADSNNATYLVDMKPVSKGTHKITVYAHNPVGWSKPLQDSKLRIHVISSAVDVYRLFSLVPMLMITLIVSIIQSTCCH